MTVLQKCTVVLTPPSCNGHVVLASMYPHMCVPIHGWTYCQYSLHHCTLYFVSEFIFTRLQDRVGCLQLSTQMLWARRNNSSSTVFYPQDATAKQQHVWNLHTPQHCCVVCGILPCATWCHIVGPEAPWGRQGHWGCLVGFGWVGGWVGGRATMVSVDFKKLGFTELFYVRDIHGINLLRVDQQQKDLHHWQVPILCLANL